jgi:hypothetical protein
MITRLVAITALALLGGCATDVCVRHSDCDVGQACTSGGVCTVAPPDAEPAPEPPDASADEADAAPDDDAASEPDAEPDASVDAEPDAEPDAELP